MNMIKRLLDKGVQLALGCIGIIFVAGIPILLQDIGHWNLEWKAYWSETKNVFFSLQNPNELTYFSIKMFEERPLLPFLMDAVIYSLTILVGALLTASVLAILLTLLTMNMSLKGRQRFKFLFFLFESIPDILIILGFQLFIVFFYKKTEILLFPIATLGENRAYFIPILCLAILPMVQFYRLNMLNFEREETQNYVELARSLGFGKWYVQTKHIFRNAVLSVFFQSKKILWFMLSNLFILELLFNINGVTSLLVSYMSPSSFAMALLCLFVPVFIVYSLLEIIVERKANRGEVLT